MHKIFNSTLVKWSVRLPGVWNATASIWLLLLFFNSWDARKSHTACNWFLTSGSNSLWSEGSDITHCSLRRRYKVTFLYSCLQTIFAALKWEPKSKSYISVDTNQLLRRLGAVGAWLEESQVCLLWHFGSSTSCKRLTLQCISSHLPPSLHVVPH